MLVSSYSISYFSLRGTGLPSASFTGNSKKIKKIKHLFFSFLILLNLLSLRDFKNQYCKLNCKEGSLKTLIYKQKKKLFTILVLHFENLIELGLLLFATGILFTQGTHFPPKFMYQNNFQYHFLLKCCGQSSV